MSLTTRFSISFLLLAAAVAAQPGNRTGTPRTEAELLYLYRQDQSERGIKAQTARDFVRSVRLKSLTATDSATAGIQEAITAASPAGTVIIPCGTHVIHTPITIQTTASVTSRVSIRGEDRACAVIQAAADFPSGQPGILISDNNNGSDKYDTARYGISEVTLDFRLATNSDIVQIGTSTDVGAGKGPSIHNVNFFGGKRWLYILSGDKGWVTDCYFIKEDSAADGIYIDVTGATRGDWSLSDLEIGTNASSAGSGDGINIQCDDGVTCGYTLLNNINLLGKWRNALRVEDTVAATGMYVMVDRIVIEAYTSSYPVAFINSNFNQIRSSWISQFATDTPALLLDESFEFVIDGNYFYVAGAHPHAYISGGDRHLWTGNRFTAQQPAFGFDEADAPAASTIGFNHYSGLVTNQQSFFNTYALTGVTNNYAPMLSPFRMIPFTIPVSESGGQNVLILENSDEGTTNGKKWITVDSTGGLRVLDNAGTTINLRSSESGALEIRSGGADNKGTCWKTAVGGVRQLGYCSSALDSNGACTCN